MSPAIVPEREAVVRHSAVVPCDNSEASAPRFLLYAHDSCGLGHLRRTLAIAGALSRRFTQSNTLIVSGSPCATHFRLPDRCDLVKLPSVTKDASGGYVARRLSLGLLPTILVRQQTLIASFRAFDPHVVIIDHQLTGLMGECMGLLHEAKMRGVRTIYGMRDILDSPQAVRETWSTPASLWALSKGYDAVCVYGSANVFDPRVEYPFLSEHAKRIEFTGYIVPPEAVTLRRSASRRPKVLVTMGGGEDGSRRISRYFEALSTGRTDFDSHVITGPLMDPNNVRTYRRWARGLQGAGKVTVTQFRADIQMLLRQSDAVVSMAGYNTCAEILQSGCPAVLLPRTFPRREQLMRATRLSALRLVDTLVDATAEELRSAVEQAISTGRRGHSNLNLDGLSKLCAIVEQMITPAGTSGRTTQRDSGI